MGMESISSSTSLSALNSDKQSARTQSIAASKIAGRKKAFHYKVATGCLTCKLRHVKCDEAKPNCLRCTKAGRKCEGYAIRKTWMFETPKEKSARAAQEAAVAVSAATLCDQIKAGQGTDLERWNYQYFFEVIIPTIAGWSFTNGFQDLEHGLLQQFAHSVPAVRHLAIALASRHKDTMSLSTQRSSFASSEVAKALNKLIHADEETSVDTVLLCCFLLATYEHFDPHAADCGVIPHREAAYRILNDPATKWSPVTKAIYVRTQHVEMVASVLNTPIFLPGAITNDAVHRSIPVLPEAFSTPTEMQRKFFDILRWRFLYSLHSPVWDRHCSGFLRVLDLLSSWYTLVCDYITHVKAQKRTGDDLQLATTMSIQFRMVYTALWFSVTENSPKHQHPGHANLVDLSSQNKIAIHIPTKFGPQPHDRTTRQKQIGVWPAVEDRRSSYSPLYVTVTFHADGGAQDDAGHPLERLSARHDSSSNIRSTTKERRE